MSKITLNNVGSLIDATTAANTINANSATIQTAFDNTLSRDGTQPNTMAGSLDMNSHQIINLPAPGTSSSPARLSDLNSLVVSGKAIITPSTTIPGSVVSFSDTGGQVFSTTPVFEAGNPCNAALYSPIAAPAAGAGTFSGLQVGLGTPLTASDIPSPTGRLEMGVVGTVNIAAPDTAISSYGTAGVATSNSTINSNAIGAGGFGYANATNANAWSVAGSVHNKTPSSAVGFDANSVIGAEYDLNIWRKAGAVEPTIPHIQGVLVAGGGDSTTNQGSAFEADRLSVTSGAKWTNGFISDPGASVNAFVAGPTARTGNNLASQGIVLQETDGTGSIRNSKIVNDGTGQIIIQAPSTGARTVQLSDTLGAVNMSVGVGVGGSKVQIPALSTAGIVTNNASGILGSTVTGTGVQTALGVNTNAVGGLVTFAGTAGTSVFSTSNAVLNATPANPTATASTTLVMMGLGVATCRITPVNSTRLQFTVTGQMSNTTAGDGAKAQLCFGTGAGPANGAAATGTTLGGTPGFNAVAGGVNSAAPFTVTGIATGLTIGTTYWFDVQLAAVIGGTASITALGATANEI